MRRIAAYVFALVMLSVLAAGCVRIPLYERNTNVNIALKLNLDINLDLDLSVETELDKEYSDKLYGKMPEYVEALFYDVETHDLVKSFILPAEGGLVNVPTGDYNLVVYSFGTESTQVGNLHHRLVAEAYTTDITKQMASKIFGTDVTGGTASKVDVRGYEDDPIIHEPDHLYVANEDNVSIPSFTGKEETVIIHADAKSILDVYSLEVLNIKGAENIEKVEAFITGQIRSNYFGLLQRNDDPATLYVTMKPDVENARLYTVFGTFGKLAGETNNVYLDITVTDSGGGQYRYIYDVTDQFDDPDNKNNKLVIDCGDTIDIPEASQGGGGFRPSVDNWKDEEVDIPLG